MIRKYGYGWTPELAIHDTCHNLSALKRNILFCSTLVISKANVIKNYPLQQFYSQTTAPPRCACICDLLTQLQYKIWPRKKICPWNCKAHCQFSENQQSQRVSIVMWIHFIWACAYSSYFSLHPTASRVGDIISIPRVPWSTFCTINRLIEGPELESVRRWKVCFELERPLSNQNFRHCRGTLSYKMPSSTHELLANLHLYYSKKCGIWAPKIVSTRLKLDIGEVIFLTQDPQVLYLFKYNHDLFLQHLLIALTCFFWNRRLAKR